MQRELTVPTGTTDLRSMELTLKVAAIETAPTGHRKQPYQVSPCDDPHEPALAQDGNTSHTLLYDEVSDRFRRGILRHCDHISCHHVSCCATTLGDQIELGHDAQNAPLVIDDRNSRNTVRDQRLGDLIEGRVRMDSDDIGRHDLSGIHRVDRITHKEPRFPPTPVPALASYHSTGNHTRSVFYTLSWADSVVGGAAVERADFVIIGAGIMGCSVAYHLAERRAGRIVVLERDEIARGATADAAGGIRLQFSTETNIRLSLLSFEYWEHFTERFGVDIGLHQYGYLFLLTRPEDVSAFRASLALQTSLGVPARWVEPQEIAELQPAVRTDDLLGGTFCPRDGWCDPYTATMGFATAARELGVEFREHCPVTGFRIVGDRLQAVLTPEGEIACGTAIICAGPYTGEVGKLAGLELPVVPYRRMSFVTEPFELVPKTVPMTIEFESSLYFHPEGEGFLFGMSNPNEPPGFHKTVDPEWMTRTVEALCRRAPVFEQARIRRGWAGFYEVTPDANPLIGRIEEIDGLAVAAGFSGHGFMHGPAVGRCMAELLLDGVATSVDIRAFSPARFRQGQLIQERNVI